MKQAARFLLLVLLCLPAAWANAVEQDRTFRIINASDGLSNNSVHVVVCTKTGRMIISTIGNLNFYDGNGFSHIDTQLDYQYPLEEYGGNYHLYFDHSHHIWLKSKHMVTCVDLITEQFIPNVDSVFQAMGCKDIVRDLFTDSIGTLWYLTDNGLVNAENDKTFPVLEGHNLQDMDVTEGRLFFFYENGKEVAFDLESGRMLHETFAYAEDKQQEYERSSVLRRYGDGFFQLRNGERHSILMFFNIHTLEWKTVLELPYHMNNLAMQRDLLYIATEYGYWVYNPVDGHTEHIEELTLVDGSKLGTDCNTLTFDRQGGMWIGTERRGLLYARPYPSPFKVYPWSDPMAGKYAMLTEGLEQNIREFQGRRANCKYVDSRGWTWIGTNSGLFLYKTENSDAIIFSKKNGFYNDVVHSVVEGKRHNIWVATSSGISCIEIENDQPVFVNSFGEEDNVPSEAFINCKAACTDDSLIVMQGLDHMVVFRPKDLDSLNVCRPYKLNPKLIRLLVNGTVVEPNMELEGTVVISKAVTRTKHIYLNSSHKSVTFIFSGLNYYRPRQTFYRVHLKGNGRDEWADYSNYDSHARVDDNGMLRYSLVGIEAGEYEITVQASMFPNQWDDDEKYQWIIHVSKPWWRTTGLYLLMGLFILVLGIYNLVYYARNTRMKLYRDREEGDVLSKIRAFVDRNDALKSQLLMPTPEEHFGSQSSANMHLPDDFIDVMQKIMPYIREHRDMKYSMHDLSDVAQVNLAKLFAIVSPHIHKSPREMVRRERLNKAAVMLRTTDKSIETIAAECGFYSPNYLIGNFFRRYKMTPGEYRKSPVT